MGLVKLLMLTIGSTNVDFNGVASGMDECTIAKEASSPTEGVA